MGGVYFEKAISRKRCSVACRMDTGPGGNASRLLNYSNFSLEVLIPGSELICLNLTKTTGNEAPGPQRPPADAKRHHRHRARQCPLRLNYVG